MGFGGISIWQMVIVLGIIILLFGTKKLRNLGGDVGSAVKGFKKAMNETTETLTDESKEAPTSSAKVSENETEAAATK